MVILNFEQPREPIDMALDPRQANVGLGTRAGVQAVDAGLRAYMLKVYNYMASGLALTGIVAYGVSTSEAAMQVIFGGGMLCWVIALAPLGLGFYLSARINSMQASTAQTRFW